MVTADQAAGRQCILEQAQRLFFAHGYHGVSIRDIVQPCGLAKATLYYHFGSKQNLFVEAFKEYVGVLVKKVQGVGAGQGSCAERLIRLAGAYAQFVLDARIESQILLRDLMEFDSEEIRHLIRDAENQIPSMFATVLEEGIAAGEIRTVDVQHTSILVHGMINALTAPRMFDREVETLPEDITLAINTLFEGIGT
jgi:TetR/AcrR family transcriptional repressor of mexJK operon